MSAIYYSDILQAVTKNANAGSDTITRKAIWTLSAASAANHVGEMFIVPQYYELVDFLVALPALGASAVLRAGYMIGTPLDKTFANRTTANAIGSELIATTGATGTAGGIVRADQAAFLLAGATTPEAGRSVGVQITTNPGTPAAIGTKITAVCQMIHMEFWR